MYKALQNLKSIRFPLVGGSSSFVSEELMTFCPGSAMRKRDGCSAMYTLMEAYQHSVKQVAKLLSVADTFL
jgi:hypothetical protein